MITPPIPADEARRLAALHGLGILDTPPEQRFDRITRLAQRLFDVPIVLVSLVDTNRQWFKSCQGLPVRETSRDVSFCGHAIVRPGALIVPDALTDVRFADNPLVTGDPLIRFYAGRPLSVADGSQIGTLCLIDRQPRQFSDEQLHVLDDLAALVEDQLHLIDVTDLQQEMQEKRRVEDELRRSEARFRSQAAYLDLAHDSILVRDLDDRIIFWNRGAEKYYGWSRKE